MTNENKDNKPTIDEIDLTDVDWNKLSVKDFNELEKKLQEKHRLIKKEKIKGVRASGYSTVKIRGEVYSIKTILFNRLKKLKSDKAREKLINEIIITHNPLEKL